MGWNISRGNISADITHVIYFRVHGRNDLLSVRAAELQVLRLRLRLLNSRNDGCWKHVFRSPKSRAYRSRNVTLLTYEYRVALREALYVGQENHRSSSLQEFYPFILFFLGQLNGYGRFQSRKDRSVSEPEFEYDVVELDISTHDLPNGVS